MVDDDDDDDDLAPARGCLHGSVAGCLLWIVIVAVGYVVWRMVERGMTT